MLSELGDEEFFLSRNLYSADDLQQFCTGLRAGERRVVDHDKTRRIGPADRKNRFDEVRRGQKFRHFGVAFEELWYDAPLDPRIEQLTGFRSDGPCGGNCSRGAFREDGSETRELLGIDVRHGRFKELCRPVADL